VVSARNSSDELVPWAPEDLPVTGAQLASWSYVVLEEVIDRLALLRRWPWPSADSLGRLVWPGVTEHATQAAVLDLGVLTAQLYVPSGLRRQPRCGDTFAVETLGRGWRARRDVTDVTALFSGRAYDISAAAREAAKLVYLASLAPVVPLARADGDTRDEVVAAVRARSEQRAPTVTVIRSGAPAPRRDGEGHR